MKLDISDMVSKLASIEDRAEIAIRMFAETGAKQLEADAKENARWTDRTGRARQGLKGTVSKISNGYRIYVSHTVDYGIYLEFAHERKYAIINQTINISGPFVMDDFEKFLDKLGK